MSKDSSDARKALTDEELSRRLDRLFDDGALDPDGVDAAPLKHVGDYVLIKLLGSGAFGLVYLARHYRSMEEVALKVPRPEVLIDKELRARFTCETIAARRLVHPNIVPIYDVEAAGSTPYIAAAFCPGKNLRDWLTAFPNPAQRDWQSCVRIAAQLAEAVAYAHQHQIYHRDIKPENVLLFPNVDEPTSLDDVTPKLTDFGLAKIASDLQTETRASIFLGTAMYMSPEQTSGTEARDAPATVDVYSIGVVLFELLTQRLPIRQERYQSLFDPTNQGTIEPLRSYRPDVPAALAQVCEACLAPNPAARYQSAADLATDLRAVADKQPIQPPKLPIRSRIRFYARQPKRIADCGRYMLWSHIIIGAWSIASSVGIFVYDNIPSDMVAQLYRELFIVLVVFHIPNAWIGSKIIKGRSWAVSVGLLLSLVNLLGPLMAIFVGPLMFAELYASAPFFSFSIHLMLLICFITQLWLAVTAVIADGATPETARPSA